MSPRLVRRIVLALWLAVVWVCLWGDLSPGTVVAGIAVATATVVAVRPGPDPTEPSTIRPIRALGFGLWFLWALIRSTSQVAWEIITPGSSIREGIVAVPLRGVSNTVVTIVANAITLTPGTLTVEATTDPHVLYVHVLHLDDPEQVRRDVLAIEARAIRAFGPADAVAALEEAAP